MRAKEEGDHAKVINAALDIWDRFGFCWEVADALWDGFLVWEKTQDFEKLEAYELSLTLYRKARAELPSDLSSAPMPNRDDPLRPVQDPVRDWVSLFNLAEKYFSVISPDEQRVLALELFDELLTLPPLILGAYLSWMTRYHETYGVGELSPVYEAHAEYLRQQDWGQL